MKNGRYSDAQIMAVLKQAEGGVPVSELCRESGMSSASFYIYGCLSHFEVQLGQEPKFATEPLISFHLEINATDPQIDISQTVI